MVFKESPLGVSAAPLTFFSRLLEAYLLFVGDLNLGLLHLVKRPIEKDLGGVSNVPDHYVRYVACSLLVFIFTLIVANTQTIIPVILSALDLQ
jgi:hypothetical protein